MPPLGPLDRALTDHSITRHRIRPRFHRVGIRKQIGCCLFEIMLPCRHPKSQVGTLLFSTCAPRSNMNRLRISLFLVQPHSAFSFSIQPFSRHTHARFIYALSSRPRPRNTFLSGSLYNPRFVNETHYTPLHQRINTNQTTTNTQVAMLAKFFLAPLFALAVKAVSVTSPTEGQNWGTSGAQTVSWNAVSTDPTSFSIVLVNDVSCRDETGFRDDDRQN